MKFYKRQIINFLALTVEMKTSYLRFQVKLGTFINGSNFGSDLILQSIIQFVYLQSIMHDSQSGSQWKGQKEKQPKKTKFQECYCGKRFNSQTSYNTHFKNTHPDMNSSNNRSTSKPSRGRPKQYQYKQLEQKSSNQTDPLIELKQLQERVGTSTLKGKQIYENEPVFKLISRFMEEENKENTRELRFIEQDKIYDVTMGRGLSILVKQLRAKVEKEQFLNEIILLITIYISYVIEQTQDQNVLSNGSVGLLPEFANIFILYDLSKRCERLKITYSWIKKPQTTISILNIIFKWLIYKQFTHTSAIVNEQFIAHQQQHKVCIDRNEQ